MGTCFVMQPFDRGVFDKRYEDIFAPAIIKAGLEPYRVDQDPGVSIPIEDIQSGIRNSDLCLAEISTDNPNVWFELGYAIATNKEVVLICSNERSTKFPFDVQHRSITTYKTESSRDFEELKTKITQRIVAILKKEESISRVVDMPPIAETEGLAHHEIVALVTVAGNADSPSSVVPVYTIRDDMNRSGFTNIAVTLALTSLLRKGMIEDDTDSDINGNQYTTYLVSKKGMDWLLENQSNLILRREKSKAPLQLPEEDIPF